MSTLTTTAASPAPQPRTLPDSGPVSGLTIRVDGWSFEHDIAHCEVIDWSDPLNEQSHIDGIEPVIRQWVTHDAEIRSDRMGGYFGHDIPPLVILIDDGADDDSLGMDSRRMAYLRDGFNFEFVPDWTIEIGYVPELNRVCKVLVVSL